MAVFKQTELKLDHRFDPITCRHTRNGATEVLHCHHYASLYTQLADDVSMLDGKKLLAECAEDAFAGLLKSYFAENGICTVEDRIAIAEQYYASAGLGKLKVLFAGSDSGRVELIHSHIDEGWIKKWGKRDKPVNFITSGYIAALFCAVFDLPARSVNVSEVKSIVCGDAQSQFNVVVG